jgi:diguanylate cyclase (GGDEF)-like protein
MRGVVVVLSPFVGGDYYGAIIRGVNAAATAAGARVVAVQTLDPGSRTVDGAEMPTVLSLAATRSSDGVVVLPGALDAERARTLQRSGVPVVLVGHELPLVGASSVRADNHAGVHAAVAHLAGHGHRRIAFAGFTEVCDISERRDAYVQALLAHGLEPDEGLQLHIPDNHEHGGRAAAERLLAAPVATAVVMGTDRNAIGLMQRLRGAGLGLPDDVAVVGFDDIPACRYQRPALTSIHQPLEALGATAVAMLASPRTTGGGPGDPVRLPSELVVRASCGCPDHGLNLSEAQARAQFESLEYLQATLNSRHDLDVVLLGAHRADLRSLSWLSATPANAGALGLWLDPSDPHGSGPDDPQGPRTLRIAGGHAVDGRLSVEPGALVEDVDFPPPTLLDQADGAAGRIVFVVPVRGRERDWGLLAAVGRIQDDTPPGREMMNHTGAVLTAALDREVMLASLRAQREELRRLAMHDQLTGLPNRAQLTARLESAARRSLTDPTFRYALIFLDLDGFKAINDTYGHAVGDALLTVVAERLLRATRSRDVVARHGGDEFLLLIEGIDDPAMLHKLVRRMRRSVTRPTDIDGRSLRPAASVGVVTSISGETPAELLRRADAAMYRAKARAKARTRRLRSVRPGLDQQLAP